MEVPKQFPQMVKEYRKINGLRQADLAELTGLSHYTIIRVEQGKIKPKKDTVHRILLYIANGETSKKQVQSHSILLTKTEKKVLEFLDNNKNNSFEDIVKFTGLRPQNTKIALNHLVSEGKVLTYGDTLYRLTENPSEHTLKQEPILVNPEVPRQGIKITPFRFIMAFLIIEAIIIWILLVRK